MSLLLPGHGDDAKKGEKSNPDDVDPENSGNKDKNTTSDATKNLPKQLTHVAGQGTSGVNPDVSEKSGNKDTTSE